MIAQPKTRKSKFQKGKSKTISARQNVTSPQSAPTRKESAAAPTNSTPQGISAPSESGGIKKADPPIQANQFAILASEDTEIMETPENDESDPMSEPADPQSTPESNRFAILSPDLEENQKSDEIEIDATLITPPTTPFSEVARKTPELLNALDAIDHRGRDTAKRTDAGQANVRSRSNGPKPSRGKSTGPVRVYEGKKIGKEEAAHIPYEAQVRGFLHNLRSVPLLDPAPGPNAQTTDLHPSHCHNP